MINIHSIKIKIIGVAVGCILIVGIVSNFVLYNYLSHIILEKTTYSNTLIAHSVATQIEQFLESANNLLLYTSSDTKVTRIAQYQELSTYTLKRNAINAKTQMETYLSSNVTKSYINKYALVNTAGFLVQPATQVDGSPTDATDILALPIVQQALANTTSTRLTVGISPSVAYDGENALVMIYTIAGTENSDCAAFVYLELNLDILQDVIDPYADAQPIFVLDEAGDIMLSATEDKTVDTLDLLLMQDEETFTYLSTVYQTHRVSIEHYKLLVYTYTDLSSLSQQNTAIGIPVGITIVTCFIISFGLVIILTTFITRPIQRLTNRIRRISENDFSYDKTIESSKDEIGQIGAMINEMTLSIKHLIKNEQDLQEQRKNIEIELLQSQVTPHFLYNTLDSVYWMAVIQKCPGIANMIRSLVNLLKNIAKGTNSEIPLAQEVALLQDYITIQSVRYLETFAFVCDLPPALEQYSIIKLTLQPIVENAIFHGIETSGKFGTITLSGKEEEDAICITICDDGVGMTQEQCYALLHDASKHKRSKTSMNGIGVLNVHNRLQLTYGKAYGLTVESEEGIGTCVSIRIPKKPVGLTGSVALLTPGEE